ncbi:DUF821 domain-containing protein [Zymoseptoria brevis]|uniref:DUF821 domain-containing protein n=1 Tax=Zymoseptoria brevis TaxID=1047168 RepID=A0A0F4GMS0_9PEZI|nr:DUF821 domain-containing protein [Zymoseptoria brevis]
MNPVVWKIVSGVLLLCVLVQQYGAQTSFVRLRAAAPSKQESHKEAHRTATSWTFDPARDRDNHGLTTKQCDAAFPELYHQIEFSLDHWKGTKIKSDNIKLLGGNDGGVRFLIHDQQLRIIETRGLHREDFRHRIIAVAQQILRAITAAEAANEPLPDIEFTVIVDDKPYLHKDPSAALWSFAKQQANKIHDSIWLIPDFHFFGAPPEAENFHLMQTRARQHDAPLEDKIPKVVWRGVEWTNQNLRKPLLEVTAGKPWADVEAMKWKDPNSVISMDEFCKYRYVVNTEGRSWSARLTHLLNCDSLVLGHDVEWVAHYYHLFDTLNNCVRVERDWSDLESTIAYYDENLDEAQKIANRTKEMFRDRYTTPAATACYWRKLMRAWSTVAFEPKVIDETKKGTIRLRGISFEEFIVHDNTRDYPYRAKAG